MQTGIPKIMAVSDLTGYGRCALTVALPVISAMGIQCCPVPTAVLSNHPGFGHCSLEVMEPSMKGCENEWRKLGLTFDGIYIGCLFSKEQVEWVLRCEAWLSDGRTKRIVDPVMGDHGKFYRFCNEELCEAVKQLAARADILKPNLTEACFLTDTPYRETEWTEEQLKQLLERLSQLGARQIVISGIPEPEGFCNAVLSGDGSIEFQRVKKTGASRSGTGDVFSSILAADAVKGLSLPESVQWAAQFVAEAVAYTQEQGLPVTDGVLFEPLLHRLLPGKK